VNAFGLSSVSFERSRVVKILIRGSQATRSLPGAVGGRVRLACAPGQVKPARFRDSLRLHVGVAPPASPTRRIEIDEADLDREPTAMAREGVLGVLQRAGRDRCARCAEPIEPGLLALAAIMCAACRAKP
jgi:hypothetical protein